MSLIKMWTLGLFVFSVSWQLCVQQVSAAADLAMCYALVNGEGVDTFSAGLTFYDTLDETFTEGMCTEPPPASPYDDYTLTQMVPFNRFAQSSSLASVDATYSVSIHGTVHDYDTTLNCDTATYAAEGDLAIGYVTLAVLDATDGQTLTRRTFTAKDVLDTLLIRQNLDCFDPDPPGDIYLEMKFGAAVDINSDGIAVASITHPSGGGAVVVFHTTDHPTVEQWSLSNTYVLGDANHKTSQNYATNFGHAVAIDTDNLYVSSPHYDQAGVTGEITIFTRGPGEEWKDSANLIIRKLGANNFPANCDLCCNSNCLGYPGTWETQYDMDAYQFADVGERFAHGASLETSLDVVVVTVGAYVPDTNDYGSVYLFGYEDENDPEGFMFGLFINTEPPTTQSPGSSSSSASTYNPGAGWFGSSAKYTIFNDQYIMAISYYGMNTVNIYYSDESTWTEIRHTPDAQLFSSFASDSVMFGYSIAFHENTLLVSDPYAYLNSGGSGPRFGLVEGFVLSTVYQKWSSMLVLDGWSVSSTQEEGSTYQGQSIDFDGSVFMMTTSNVILSSKLDCKDDCLSCYEDPTYSQCVDAYDSCDVVLACNGDCLNGGVCDVVYNKCNCTATAFKGNYCETQKTDPCTVQDCSQNGDCEADSTLTDFTCVCDHTWSGETCDRSECGSAACGEFGSCSGGVVGAYMCTCDEGWTTGADQYLCDELAFCWGTATCENGGVCTQGACNCAGTGFTGEVCDTPLSYSGDDYGVDYSYNDASTAADDTYSGSGQSDFVARPGSDDGSDGLASSSSSSSSSSEDDSSTTGVSTFTSSPAGEDAGEEIVTVDIVLTNKQMDCSAFVDIDACVNALPEMLAESFDGTTQHDFVIDTNQLILSEDGILFINLTFSGNTTETVEELEDQIQASAIFVEDTTSADLSDDGSAETSTDGSAMMIVLVAAALIFASGIGLTYIMMKKRNGASKVYVNGTKSKPKKMVMPV